MSQMKRRFPSDMDYAISLDTTGAVTEGMKEIVVTLVIAIVLVILVVYLFLQDWRATLIPLLAVEDLITVLTRHFLAIVVLQCDIDRDVGLKLNFLAHLTLLLSSPRRMDVGDEVLDQLGRA
jgi:multidrug efflux pump subunit AcrB